MIHWGWLIFGVIVSWVLGFATCAVMSVNKDMED